MTLSAKRGFLARFVRWAGRSISRRWGLLCCELRGLRDGARRLRLDACFRAKALRRRYPLRATRYWHALEGLQDEQRPRGQALTILDMGCGKGISRVFVGDHVDARWIGLDWRPDTTRLQRIGYDQVFECDFDQRLPVADHSVDVVICLHVLEHLPRPEFAISEISRVLRPGGVLLAATPVKPEPIGRLRQIQLRGQLRRGQRRPGKHINAFWPDRWRDLCRSAGLDLETFTGGYLLRWAGNPLESFRTWIRLNQVWGALFPSLGGEILLKARLAAPAGALPSNAPRVRPVVPVGVWRWAGRAAEAALLAVGLLLAWPQKPGCPVDALVRTHQDGDDVFYAMAHPELVRISRASGISILECPTQLVHVFSEVDATDRDVHLFVTEEHLRVLSKTHPHLRIVGRTSLNGTPLYLLGSEGYGDPLPQTG
jgi:SAM-dependent methyltransferase